MAAIIIESAIEVTCEVGSTTGAIPITVKTDEVGAVRSGVYTVGVLDDRWRGAATEEALASAVYGDDFALADIDFAGVGGFVEMRSLDANEDGFDDLDIDQDNSHTFAAVLSLPQDNIVVNGTGAVTFPATSALTASGTANAPVESGTGSVTFAAVATLTATGIANGAGSATFAATSTLSASGTANEPAGGFTDTFATLDTARWGVSTGGSQTVTVTGGKLVFAGADSDDDCGIVAYKTPLDMTKAFTIKSLAQVRLSALVGDPVMLSIQRQATIPVVSTAATFNAAQIIGISSNHVTDGDTQTTQFTYWDTLNAAKQFNGTSWTGTPALSGGDVADNTYFTFIIEHSLTAGTGGTPALRCIVKNSTEATTYVTSTWVDRSAIRTGSGDYWLVIGDPFNNVYTKNMDVDTFTLTYS